MDWHDRISVGDAFLALQEFLSEYYQQTSDDGIGGLLGSLSDAGDGDPLDIAMLQEWLQAVERAVIYRESRKK